MKALLVFGARPNYMKIAPLYRAMIRERWCTPVLVNTGQHFDRELSDALIDALELPEPNIHLHVGPGTQAEQMGKVMQKLEPVLSMFEPDVTVVVGDVSSTLAAALASSTVGVPVAHIEAGLRSRDWSMPEERNRVLTDRLSRCLFTHSPDADENLKAEGIDPAWIHNVGNVMIDTLDWVLPRLPRAQVRATYDIPAGPFALATLHRPANVDDPTALKEIIAAFEEIGDRLPLIFPIHPRTRNRLAEFAIRIDPARIRVLPPLAYPEFMSLLSEAAVVLTDSGGIQEETTVLGVPCLTLRPNTERPITLQYGANELVKAERSAIVSAADRALCMGRPQPQRPPRWDGQAAVRIVGVLREVFAPTALSRAAAPAGESARSPFTAIILAGGLRPSPLSRELGMPALCLPLGGASTLLSSWLDAFIEAGDCHNVRIVVSDEEDSQAINGALAAIERPEVRAVDVRVMVEPARWRGTGGIIRDVVDHMPPGEVVLLAEAGCLPPPDLHRLLESLDGRSAAVGVDGLEPAGVYALRRQAFELVPRVGFFDIKEQLLPALYKQGTGAHAVRLGGQTIRVRTRGGYLQAVSTRVSSQAEAAARLSDMLAGRISRAARIEGACVVGRSVVIEERAVVHDSVILDGAVVRRGAVVSRSVIGAGAEVADGRIVIDSVEPSRSGALRAVEPGRPTSGAGSSLALSRK
jgi:UDP-N-acetylglucosamine 2-epimerase (non-hydrolysing)